MARKIVLITGCSDGGIGSALALEFDRRGHSVFATARNTDKMAQLRGREGITLLEMDVTSEASISAAVAAVSEQMQQQGGGGRQQLDILINNAGVNHVMPFADCTMADFRHVLDTNLLGVVAVTHAFLPLLIASKGVVASIGSVNEVFRPPYQAAYNTSKAALTAFGDTIRNELSPFGVRVVTVITGSVRSKLFENAAEGPRRGATKLPQGSMYESLRQRIEQRSFLDGVKWTPTEDYAKQLAGDLLKQKQAPILWRAAFSFVARLISIFGWTGMLDGSVLKMNGLNTLKSSKPAPALPQTNTAEGGGTDAATKPHKD